MNKKAAKQNLITLKTVLTANNIPFWITDGTLLGAYRENDIMDHDKDTDIAAFADEWDDKVIEELQKNHRFTLITYFGSRNCGREYALWRNGVKTDVFLFYRDTSNNTVWHAAWKNNKMIRYRYETFGLSTRQFLGETFPVPDDIEKFLITKYGPEWRTPVTKWDWAFGPRNAEMTSIVHKSVRPKGFVSSETLQ